LSNTSSEKPSYARIQFFIQLTPAPTYIAVIGRVRKEVTVDPALAAWHLPRQGMIGKPLTRTIPRWVGTTLFGKREDGSGSDILNELRSIDLIR
jgi:hypothetical protein